MSDNQLHLSTFNLETMKSFDLKDNCKYTSSYNKRLSEFYE